VGALTLPNHGSHDTVVPRKHRDSLTSSLPPATVLGRAQGTHWRSAHRLHDRGNEVSSRLVSSRLVCRGPEPPCADTPPPPIRSRHLCTRLIKHAGARTDCRVECPKVAALRSTARIARHFEAMQRNGRYGYDRPRPAKSCVQLQNRTRHTSATTQNYNSASRRRSTRHKCFCPAQTDERDAEIRQFERPQRELSPAEVKQFLECREVETESVSARKSSALHS
jgi:hypothetical protein